MTGSREARGVVSTLDERGAEQLVCVPWLSLLPGRSTEDDCLIVLWDGEEQGGSRQTWSFCLRTYANKASTHKPSARSANDTYSQSCDLQGYLKDTLPPLLANTVPLDRRGVSVLGSE
jgi:hypothetical protein